MVTLAMSEERRGRSAPRVEILGAFGAGKSTLARKLVVEPSDLMLEDHRSNPFWGRPDLTAALGHLPYDISFLLHHAGLVAGAASRRLHGHFFVSDWSFQTDLLWASHRQGGDHVLYEPLHRNLTARLGAPLAYLYLEQSPELIVDRVIARGRVPEAEFLTQVVLAVQSLREMVHLLPSEAWMKVGDDTTLAEVSAWLHERGVL